jgi:hypothetical protein
MCNDCVRSERAARARKLKDRPPQALDLSHITDFALRHHVGLDHTVFHWYVNGHLYEKTEAERNQNWNAIGPVYAYCKEPVTKAVDDCVKVMTRLNELGYKFVPAIGKVASPKEIDEYLHFMDET